ncbi:MAG: hypothetical protein MUC88_01185 [Planctomycetes bacterium]|jgi:hypothetical protein|nr:hypothetical protein [Planctomycetota bacterium]
MKTVRQIRLLFRNAGISSRPEGDRTVLAEALAAGGLIAREHPVCGRRTIWRFLMNSRMTKLAAVVIVIAAVVVGVHYLNDTAVKAVEFSEMTQAMQRVPWMHVTGTGFELPPGEADEQWVGFEAGIQATKRANGRATFMSEKDHRQWEYDPDSTTITLSYLEAFPIDLPAPGAMLATIRKHFEEEGAEVVVRRGSYRGREVQVQDITTSGLQPGKGSSRLTVYVDPHSRLLYGAEIKAFDGAGNVVGAGTGTYDYPPTGPQSIHDLGVPREARVVDRTPGRDFKAVWEEYRRYKAEAANEYIAVMVHQEKVPSEVARMLDVEYKSGRKVRHERYFLSPRGETIAELGPRYQEQLGRSLEPLLAWARRRLEDPTTLLQLHLYDGQYYHSTGRDGDGKWEEPTRAYSPNNEEISLSQTLAYQAWPTIPSTARIISDDYTQQNGLLCLENLTQGQLIRNMVQYPGRFLYYLDLARDYLCRRHVMEWRPDAAWQQDKDWLKKAGPNTVKPGVGMVVHEITEVSLAPNGHWYPRVIVQKQAAARIGEPVGSLQVYDTQTIYLDLSPTFPAGIFDPQRLPGR